MGAFSRNKSLTQWRLAKTNRKQVAGSSTFGPTLVGVSRLESLGLRIETTRAFDNFLESEEVSEEAQIGRVARVDRGEVAVLTDQGEVRAVSDSQRAQSATAPVTGDWVVVAPDDEVGLHVARVLPRHTAMVRRDPAEQVSDQVLVANIDRVAVVHGLDQAANDARIERFLVLAIDSGAEPLVVLTKNDLGDVSDEYDWLSSVAPVVVTSALADTGIDELKGMIGHGETLVFIGPSGVGKSTLVNAIIGEEVAETAEVREGDRRGRHTTTVRELIELPDGGVVIDTPGIRAIGLWAADIALDEVFADIAELAVGCRFRDCTHRSEPGCAVAAAVVAGEIQQVRLARYQLLWQELAEQAIDIERRQRAPSTSRRNKRRRK